MGKHPERVKLRHRRGEEISPGWTRSEIDSSAQQVTNVLHFLFRFLMHIVNFKQPEQFGV